LVDCWPYFVDSGVPGYEDEDLVKMEDNVAPLSQDLANRIADAVLP
jgi:hypothetical protein